MQSDDFYLFRYEMNTIFQKHLFQDEGKSDFLLGKKPLSKVQGVPVKEMVESLKTKKDNFKGNLYDNLNRKCQEIYVPPGVVKLTPTVFEKEVKVREEIRLAQPSDKIQLRQKKKEDKQDVQALQTKVSTTSKNPASSLMTKQTQKLKE